MVCGATYDGQVIVKSSDKAWSTEEGNGKPLLYPCREDPMNSMKRQKKNMMLEDEPPRLEGAQWATGEERRAIANSSRKMKWLGQNGNDA